MNSKKQLIGLAVVFVVLGALFVAARLARREPGGAMAGITLAKVGGGGTVALDSCPTDKCVTVVVAPWCGVCRASTGLINALAEYFKGRGTHMRVVVSQGPASEVEAYAKEFGPEALLDPEGRVPAPGGVPSFVLTDKTGKVLRRMPGVPGVYQPPYKQEVMRDLEFALGL